MKFVQEGELLTGTYSSDMGKAMLSNGTVKGSDIAFDIVRDGGFTIHYTGKLQGNTIKGKTTLEVNGQKQSHDWEAKRVD
jgi:hypothetical protein